MKKLFFIPIFILLVSAPHSSLSSQKESSSGIAWIGVPLLGSLIGFGYTYLYKWKEHPDTQKIRTIENSEKKTIEADKQFNSTNNPWKMAKNVFKAGKNAAKLGIATADLELATDREQEDLLDFDNQPKRQEILNTIFLRAKEKEFTQINKDAIIKYGATGAGVGFALVVVSNLLKGR